MESNKIDVKKFFDKKEYNTVLVGQEDFSPAKLADLLDSGRNNDLREDALKLLKEKNAEEFLVQCIKENRENENNKSLVAAFWEIRLSVINHLPLFIDIALHDDYLCSLEALTAIENSEKINQSDDFKPAIASVSTWLEKNSKSEKFVLIESLLGYLKSLEA